MKRLLKEAFMLLMCCAFPGSLLLQCLWLLYSEENLGLAGAGVFGLAWISAIGVILLASVIFILLAALRSNRQPLCFNRIFLRKGEKWKNLARMAVYLLSFYWIVHFAYSAFHRGEVGGWIWCFAPAVSVISIFTLLMNLLPDKGQEQVQNRTEK